MIADNQNHDCRLQRAAGARDAGADGRSRTAPRTGAPRRFEGRACGRAVAASGIASQISTIRTIACRWQSYIALMRAAKELTNDPALALHYGEAVDLGELSIAGLIMNASETMGDAFVQMNRFGRLAIEVEGVGAGADRFKGTIRDGAYWVVETRANPNDFPELTEVTFARMACQPRRFLPKPHVLEVHVTHAAPDYRAEYERVFGCPVVFDSTGTRCAGPEAVELSRRAAAPLCLRRPQREGRGAAAGAGAVEVHARQGREPADAGAAHGRYQHGRHRREDGRQPPDAVPPPQGRGRDVREGARRAAPSACAALSRRPQGVGERDGLPRRLFRSGRVLARIQALDRQEPQRDARGG